MEWGGRVAQSWASTELAAGGREGGGAPAWPALPPLQPCQPLTHQRTSRRVCLPVSLTNRLALVTQRGQGEGAPCSGGWAVQAGDVCHVHTCHTRAARLVQLSGRGLSGVCEALDPTPALKKVNGVKSRKANRSLGSPSGTCPSSVPESPSQPAHRVLSKWSGDHAVGAALPPPSCRPAGRRAHGQESAPQTLAQDRLVASPNVARC